MEGPPAAAGRDGGYSPIPPGAALPRASRVARWGYPLLGLSLFALYLPTLARGATFTDGPELVAAVVSLGVAHPTGYPVFILVGHAFCKLLALPLLACVKIEIFNALCAASASVFAAHTTRTLALLGKRSSGASLGLDADLGGLLAGVMLGIAPLVWEEVRIPEVYALHLFLAAWAGYAWIRFEATGKTGYVLAAALPMGIGLAHHVTMVYMLPAALVYLLVRRPSFFVAWLVYPVVALVRVFKRGFAASRRFEGWWGFPVACVVGFLPLLSYGYLIWANKHTTGVPWGDVHDWDTLYAHFTGRQYQGFMNSLDRAGHLARLKQMAPLFDTQFLPEGTLLFFTGLAFAFRRRWRPALFFFAYLLFNLAHGAHYGVGDYATYYIPAVYTCALFIGTGASGLLELARTRPPWDRAWLGFTVLAIMLFGAALSIVLYAYLTNRLPKPLAAHPFPLAVPLALLAAASVAAAVRAYRRPGWPRPLGETALPGVVVAGLVLSLVPVSLARAHDFSHEPTVGESYGAELAERLPPGAVFMTQGDGFLFTMWYENHVLDRALDVATVDMGNTKTPWFQRYVFSHHPVACDPLGPENLRDPAGYARRCDTLRKRMSLRSPDAWVSFGFAGNRKPYATPASRLPILRGADPQCADKKWHDEHTAKECRCWGYGHSSGSLEGMLEEDCVESAEEGGVVPREPVEIFAQRIVEDMIRERPVLERNVLTQWAGGANNPRGWEGPTYQRISAEYALVGRGRFNQIVHFADIEHHDACAPTFQPIKLRPASPPRAFPPGQERRHAYVPNPRPTLLHASYLVDSPGGRDDDALRTFHAGQPVLMQIDWFEKYTWDASKPDKRGKPIHHGLRVCVHDPEGRKVTERAIISGTREALPLLEKGAERPGTWHVSACTVGEVGDQRPPLRDDQKCAWTVLQYDFAVR